MVHGPREQVGVGDDQVTAFVETLKKGTLVNHINNYMYATKFEVIPSK